jgi:hypothetical protein
VSDIDAELVGQTCPKCREGVTEEVWTEHISDRDNLSPYVLKSLASSKAVGMGAEAIAERHWRR